MAHKKAGGSVKNVGDSQPKYLGVKVHDGEAAKAGAIIIRQRGTRITVGTGVGIGRDHTLFALKTGKVKFSTVRKTGYDGRTRRLSRVSVI